MALMNLAYLEDGEWLSVSTNIERSGSLISIEPEESHSIAATDPSRGWARMISPTGNFKMNAPYDDRLNDWGLQLDGLTRVYDRLKFDVISELFGEETTAQIHSYHQKYAQKRESVGDLLAKFMRRGPLRIEEGFGMMKNHNFTVERDINALTRDARANLLKTATEDSGRLVIARSVLIEV